MSIIIKPDYSKMTVEELNIWAKNVYDYKTIVKFCELGANDYNGIFESYEHCVKTSVYLLNKSYIKNLDKFLPEIIDVYLKAGAGRMLMYYPEFLKLPTAQPYIKRHADITEQLTKKLIPEISKIVIEYLSYEIPSISDEEMDELEKIHDAAIDYIPESELD